MLKVVRSRPGLFAALVLCTSLASAGCSGSGGGDEPADSKTGSTYPAPTGSPFTAELTGPDIANAGQTVTATITNTGRLPDRYTFETDPKGAATVDPTVVTLEPGKSAEVTITVTVSPLIVRAISVGGGGGTEITELSLGSQG